MFLLIARRQRNGMARGGAIEYQPAASTP